MAIRRSGDAVRVRALRFRSRPVRAAAAGFAAVLTVAALLTADGVAPIPRKDAFFGVHYDLHPGPDDTNLGADVTEENVREVLRRVRPDYVQYDCKGHPGYAGYPTAVGWTSPGVVKDSLAVWRKATREAGVGLYIHYSGVWDAKAIREHPDWVRVDANGKPDANATSVFGPYADELMIPQLEEAAARYGLDGMWVDGDCWGAQLDYGPRALAAWTKETGFADAPRDASDPRWLCWKMFHRRAFENYLVRWTSALHAFRPSLQITSNWMYTTMAPKPVEAGVDFLSGDYSPELSVDRARYEARYLASTGMPWDLMAWGFDRGRDLGWSLKPEIHLEQEAAVVLMQGGGFQVYNTPTRAGRIVEPIIAQEEAVARFCRARQALSHKSVTVPQAALLLSTESYWDISDAVYGAANDVYVPMEGALHALLALNYSVDILAEHQLAPKIRDYPLVVVPDWPKLAPGFAEVVTDYVKGGGSLLLLGDRSARLFPALVGAEWDGETAAGAAELTCPGGGTVAVDGAWGKVRATTGAVASRRFPTRDTREAGDVAAVMNVVGRGKVGTVFGPAASVYYRTHHPWLRESVGAMTRELFPSPAVSLPDRQPVVDVSLRRARDGRLTVHLFNTSNMPLPDRYRFIDFVPELRDVRVAVKVAARPKSVEWAPDGGTVAWDWRDGVLSATVPVLRIHGILAIDDRN